MVAPAGGGGGMRSVPNGGRPVGSTLPPLSKPHFIPGLRVRAITGRHEDTPIWISFTGATWMSSPARPEGWLVEDSMCHYDDAVGRLC